MANIIINPGKYVQGKGELKSLGSHVSALGTKALVIISPSGQERFSGVIRSGLDSAECGVVFSKFNGECSQNEINRLLGVLQENHCDVVVGVGGGKILDTAKAVAYHAKTFVAIVPTIASTDAPCSALTAIYTDDGIFESYLFLPSNPNLVLVDTDVITAAPVRLFVAGMGDALATYFEARAVKAANASTCAGGHVTLAAMQLAKLCYDTLMAEGLKATLAMERHVCTKAVENIIEANTYLSGVGFESGGLAAAHAIHNGFTVLKDCHGRYHGEKVAFGTIVQLVLEDAPIEEISEVIDFCLNVGLPVTLHDIGVHHPSPEDIMRVAQAATSESETIHNMPFEVTAETVYAAILGADAMGRFYAGECDCADCE